MADKADNGSQNQNMYKEQKKVGLISFFAELPNFIAVLVSAILSHSLIMWLDLVDSFSNVLRSAGIFFSSFLIENNKIKNPKRLDFIVAMLCYGSVLFGMFVLLFTSIIQIINPEEPQDSILLAIFLKVINVLIDLYVLNKQTKILKKGESEMVRAEYNGLLKDAVFDSVTFVVVLISYVFISYKWSWYLSPVICLLMCITFIIRYVKDIFDLIRDNANNK